MAQRVRKFVPLGLKPAAAGRAKHDAAVAAAVVVAPPPSDAVAVAVPVVATTPGINTIKDLLVQMRTGNYPSSEAAINDMKAMLSGFTFRDTPDDPRILLSSARNKCEFNKQIHVQAYGLIIDTKTWQIIAASNPMMNPKPDMKFVRRNYSKYRVYPIIDGTVITIYHWQDQWHIGSHHGVDVSEYRWMGSKTYREMFDELLAATTMSLNKLDKTKCYVVGFRHHNMHPFQHDQQKVWFIDAYTFADDAIVSTFDEDAKLFAENNILVQRSITIGFDEMLQHAKNALSKGVCNYGYILRGPYTSCHANANILIESSLMFKIRKLMYNMPKHCDKIGQVNIDHTTRQNFFCLRAYLDYNSRAVFIKLFPQFSAHYAEYKRFMEQLANRILQCYRNKYTQSKVLGTEPLKKEPAIIDRLAQVFVTQMRNKERINPYDNITRDIILDYITNVNYISLYACLLKISPTTQ